MNAPLHPEIGVEIFDDLLRAGIVAVDTALVVRFASIRARSLALEKSGIEIRDGRLHVARVSAARRLQDQVKLLIEAPGLCQNEPALVGIPDIDGRIHHAVKVLRACRSVAQERLALLAIVDLLQQPTVSRIAAASLFGLSEREAELADYFSQGMRVDEIAQAMGIAANTARVHLRSVFAKTGCGSQIALARLFALVP